MTDQVGSVGDFSRKRDMVGNPIVSSISSPSYVHANFCVRNIIVANEEDPLGDTGLMCLVILDCPFSLVMNSV